MNDNPPIECPIQKGAEKLSGLSEDMIRTMRQLRQDLKDCPECPLYWECPTLTHLNTSVQTAIQEVVDEWGLQRLRRELQSEE